MIQEEYKQNFSFRNIKSICLNENITQAAKTYLKLKQDISIKYVTVEVILRFIWSQNTRYDHWVRQRINKEKKEEIWKLSPEAIEIEVGQKKKRSWKLRRTVNKAGKKS